MAIQLEQLCKYYDQQEVLCSINLSIPQGGVIGFLGPNGAGKSTLMKILVGLISPSSGTALVNNKNTRTNSIEVRKHIGYLPENNPLYLDMYVREYLEMIAKVHGVKDHTKTVQCAIDQTGLGVECRKKIVQLSKGYRQRVGLAQTLLHNPSILLLDEPTTGLDPNQIIEIRQLIVELGRSKTVLFSSHIMQEVEAISQRVIIINKGCIVADGTTSELQQKLSGHMVDVTFAKLPSTEQLSRINFADPIRLTQSNTIRFISKSDVRSILFQWIVNEQLILLEMRSIQNQLEDVFHLLTGKTSEDEKHLSHTKK